MGFLRSVRALCLMMTAYVGTFGCEGGLKFVPHDGGPGGEGGGGGGGRGTGAAGFGGGGTGTGGASGSSAGAGGAVTTSGSGGPTGGGGMSSTGGVGSGTGSTSGAGGQPLPGEGGAPATGSGGAVSIGGSDGSSSLSLGTTCIADSDCTSGHCADGVCCDRACRGACEACSSERTASGNCTFISGLPKPGHPGCAGAGDCAGTCKGSNANCAYPGPEKTCLPAKCTDGTAMAASTCDSAGNCTISSTKVTCGPYKCGSGACLMRCEKSADCIDGNYCANQSCLPKKAVGSVCASLDECTSAVCGGRCCSSPCTCPQPSPNNLLKNAGFDSDLSSWDVFSGEKEIGVQWNSDDVDGCPYSGSFKVVGGLGQPFQCIPVAPGMYNVGGWFKNTEGKASGCEFYSFASRDCTGDGTTDYAQIIGNDTTWTFRTATFVVSDAANSALVQCFQNTNNFFDKMFFSKGGGF